ncbi:MAG: N-acetylmuramoyl-L-alanine amidase [Myxococcales bacterium]|nr:N-acetylmuramoyl-L-alanine amidase [Myxococcales bacterium]
MSRRICFAALLAALPLLVGIDRPRGLADVTDVRHWSYAGYTRVVVETTAEVHTSVQRLGADRKANRPERLYLDLPGVWIGLRYSDPIPVGDGLLRAVRLGQNTKRRTRLVVDLERYERHRLLHLTGPPRVVLDVFAPGDAPKEGARLSSELRPVRTVVLDAGHGGSDPGAIGVGGIREKDVTLKLALQVAEHLRAEGLAVVLTRTRDRTLSLESRTALAEGARGDLFVSIHANAAPRRSAHGIETYYLDASHERHTLRVAAHENGVSAARLDPLQRTLAGLRASHQGDLSSDLARSVHGQVVSRVRREHRGVADLGVKRGPFYVLFLSSMPSILVEVGFLTNRAEARRLRNSEYAALLAESIAAGIFHYRDRRSPVVARQVTHP